MSETVKSALLTTIENIKKNPGRAKLTYRADTSLVKDVLCTAKVRNLDAVAVDEPAPFGGGDTAMSPVDLVMVALGTCQEIMYSALASVMDIPLNSVSVKLKGNLDLHGLLGLGSQGEVSPGILNISYETNIESPANEADVQNLVDAVENQCPVLDTLLRNVPVSGKAIINGAVYIKSKTA